MEQLNAKPHTHRYFLRGDQCDIVGQVQERSSAQPSPQLHVEVIVFVVIQDMQPNVCGFSRLRSQCYCLKPTCWLACGRVAAAESARDRGPPPLQRCTFGSLLQDPAHQANEASARADFVCWGRSAFSHRLSSCSPSSSDPSLEVAPGWVCRRMGHAKFSSEAELQLSRTMQLTIPCHLNLLSGCTQPHGFSH